MRLQIGVDVGGTFTDLYGLDTETGVSRIHKVSSSPTDPSSAIMQGVGELLEKFKATGELIDQLAHGTTVGTNALLQRRGPDVALLTTTGFRDLLEVGRQTRPLTTTCTLISLLPLSRAGGVSRWTNAFSRTVVFTRS